MKAGNWPLNLPENPSGKCNRTQLSKKAVRAVYSTDGAILIEAAEVIAIEFATIAAANNYWRK